MNKPETAAAIVASIGGDSYTVKLQAGIHTLTSDEPVSVGGADAGPDPFALLLCSLASCVLMTLRMYAVRKKWPLEGATVHLTPTRRPGQPLESVAMEITLQGPLTDEQRARMLEIAGRCPVDRTLETGVHVSRTLVEKL